MNTKLLTMLFISLMLFPMVKATYFEIYEFKPANCDYIDSDKIECTFRLVSNKSNLYFIETDENIQERIRSKSFLYEAGARIWPSKPTTGGWIFIGFIALIVYLIIWYKDRR